MKVSISKKKIENISNFRRTLSDDNVSSRLNSATEGIREQRDVIGHPGQ